jgi:cell division protein FtsB
MINRCFWVPVFRCTETGMTAWVDSQVHTRAWLVPLKLDRNAMLNMTRDIGGVRNAFDSRPVLASIRPYLPTAALAFLIFYFGFHAFTGDRGILSSDQRDATLVAKTKELVAVRAQRQDLEMRARLLRDTSLSADLLEERARSLLGFADPRDYVIRLKP